MSKDIKKPFIRTRLEPNISYDVIGLSSEQFLMLQMLLHYANHTISSCGIKSFPVGSFDLNYIDLKCVAPISCFNTLSSLYKLFKK